MSSRSTLSEKSRRPPTAVTINFSDKIELTKRHVEWTPHGVSLLTKWPFAVGTELEFAFDHARERHCCLGVVVSCQPVLRSRGMFSTTLYFVEIPCNELRHAACDCHLAHPKHRPPAT